MFDVLVTVLVASLSLPYHVHDHGWPSPLTILVQVALTVPLVVRRIWPSAVFAWLFAVSAVAGLWNVDLVVSFALLVALYTVAAQQHPPAAQRTGGGGRAGRRARAAARPERTRRPGRPRTRRRPAGQL
jgi:hypothetical protein